MSRYKLGDGTYSDQYKVGDKFTFAGLPYEANTEWTPEDLEGLFEFVFDDESCCPKFKSLVSGMEDYEDWCLLSKYTEVEPTTEDTQAYDSELEEALAHIETLQEALEDAVKRLENLRNGRPEMYGLCEVETAPSESVEFKSVQEYTLEDWELAMKGGWVFELNSGKEVFVKGIMDEYSDSVHPVELNDLAEDYHEGTVTLQGYFYTSKPEHKSSIKKRIR